MRAAARLVDANVVIIIVLSAVLLAAVVVLVFGVGRIVYGIARYYLRERKPIRKIRHPQLGLLTTDETDDSLWTGQVQHEGRDICFLLGGSTAAPDERLAAKLQGIIARFGDLEPRAIEFLRSREPEIRKAKLDFYTLDVSDGRRPEDFTFEFLDAADDYSGVWRVEFVGGEPKHTGFDD